MKELLKVEDIKMYFPGPSRGIFSWQGHIPVKAVDGVSFTLKKGETLGLVGESGCGKSTIARAILQLHKPTGGKVFYSNMELTTTKEKKLRAFREKAQIIFQDPYASLDPRRSIGYTIGEPLMLHSNLTNEEISNKIEDMLELVGLSKAYRNRYPHEFSGGQRQRVGIARALISNPDFIIADEPVSALDVSIQAQVINLLVDLRNKLGLTFLFISHDLRVVRYISDHVAVMYLGKMVEKAPTEELYDSPSHPYTQALLSAVPKAKWQVEGTKRIDLEGEVPSPINPPSGCYFSPRCSYATEECRRTAPELKEISPDHLVACHLRT
jgi:oligopeptide transport system ATP-binding protein